MSRVLSSNEPSPAQSGLGVFVRLGWMLFGFVGIAVTAMSIASRPTWSLGWRDGVFWGVVIATALSRYVDVVKFHGETASGERATPRDLRRYLAGLLVLSVGLWSGVQSIHM
jgi:hypothetical protein